MKRWLTVVALGVVPLILFGAPAVAQDDDEQAAVSHSEKDWDDGMNPRFALGFGFGLVNLDEEAFVDDVEPYYMASFRIRMGKPKARGMRGYLEPELGYWTRDTERAESSDLLLGINIIGVQPLGAVDFFVGGGLGAHFLDQDLVIDDVRVSESTTSLGANAQFGVDVHLGKKFSLFAAGRFDIVEERNDLEAKAYMGLRIFFE